MIYKLAIIFSIVFIIIIIKLVKQDKLDEKYSILWLLAGFIILIVSIFPKIIIFFANLTNVYYPPALMFLLAIIVLGTCIIHMSTVVTKQSKMIIRLNQELAILKSEKKLKNTENINDDNKNDKE